MRRRLRRSIMLVATTALILGALVAPASAGNGANTQLSGVAEFVDECDDEASLLTLEMADGNGNLEGCWYTDTIDSSKDNGQPSGVYQERGTETFVGCLVDDDGADIACGSFSTTYKFSSKWDPDITTGAEVHGRCQHPIVSGTGDFEGATGRVDFKDDVVTGEFLYRGHIKLNS